MTLKLTPKQKQILLYVRDSLLTRGYSPTLQEMADELGISKVTVYEHVNALERKGAIRRDPNKARSLELTDKAVLPDEMRNTRLPLVGTIAAGAPIEAVEDFQTIDLEHMFTAPGKGRSGDIFALRVRGDSMIDEHIREGDYVICQRADRAYNGQTVVALLDDGEATLKKFYKEKDGVRLQPANNKYEPIYVKNCVIQGICIGVVRSY